MINGWSKKAGIDAAKTASKQVVQKTAEATEDLIGNKIADKWFHWVKKSKEDKDDIQEIYIPSGKNQQSIYDLRLFWHHIKNKYKKITNFLERTLDNLPRFIANNG